MILADFYLNTLGLSLWSHLLSTTTNAISNTGKVMVQTIQNPTIRLLGRGFAALVFLMGILTIIHNSMFVYGVYTNPEFTEVQAGFSNLGINGTIFSVYYLTLYLLRAIISLTIALLFLMRRSDTLMGLLAGAVLVAMGSIVTTSTSMGVLQLEYTLATLRQVQNPTLLDSLFAVTPSFMSSVGYYLVAPLILLYPNGKLQPSWSLFPIVVFTFQTIAWSVFPGVSPYHPTNWPLIVSFSFTLVLWGSIVVTLWVRYRHYFTPVEKQQSKWFLYAIVIIALSALGEGLVSQEPLSSESVVADAIGVITNTVTLVATSFSIAFALFRYRLWDIDIVVNRTLVFGAILGIAMAAFFGVLFGLQLLGSTQPLLALVISVIVTASIYNFVRPRIQRFVDHRIYGLRFGLDEVNRLKHESKRSVETKGSLTGQHFGDYELLDLLGKGGMGEVYKAHAGQNTVAIKILNVDMSTDSDMRRRFEREAIAGMKLDHPNIVEVYQMQEQGDYYYMVMDFIDGHDLRKEIKVRGTIDIESALTITRRLCSALSTAHAQNYVHRDIKPANIMIASSGEPILMDFGIAKLRDGRTVITKTGMIGTIDYMAPEQVIEAKEVDIRADIYALGIVLFEMLTGERPFKGSPAQVMFAHIQQPAPDVRDLNPDIPRSIAKAIARTLEKNPDDRYQTTDAFASELNY